ncbi:2-oxoglutarate dehydrogenase complex dihydrolipoyllysine-residue succinyltransferase [Blattabacterium cuenoti]|uniref:Dihydrolipoyllysine-residue succinyltransferase component of 2-oxoglutarate dehydrogenase complex n=1 Tax=Blattabacterium cuenoti STAT TaxID=1457030 RepID=A0A224AAU9_9FLAO|nr:2-oxoglutarate dehydrogenase complex dihydrolipoyllysine-residue succinyltransferase [Blattabacterium cuenoti]BBA16987.1 2-oxoglutarate dehydrogenase, E2 component, dihydrolipoyllysine-residue succinyltransferase [Blattabacterium cuenoti STAT]
MIIQIKVPSPGESITEVEVSTWLVKNGDYVHKGQAIAEIDSDKATLEVSSEENGIITFMVEKGKRVKVGDVLCIINSSVKNIKKSKEKTSQEKKDNVEKIFSENKNIKIPSPASKKILKEKNISIESIQGSGKHGRITKKDCIFYLKKNKSSFTSNNSICNEITNKRSKIKTPLSSLRRKLSERLIYVKNQTASLTTFNEVDMLEIFLIRKKYKDRFKKKHGVNLGFMSFFTMSCIRGLKLYPDINSMISGKDKINFEYYDISIAISGPKGLMVPVIRNAEHLSFRKIEQEIYKLSTRVHNGKISIDEMKGGTFTITNGGVFGSMLSTPIINPPQSAILGMHKIMERPIVINGSIEIRPIMYLALSYDHRIIDGRESVGFLVSVKESIENPIKFLMGGNEENISNSLEL